MLRAGPGRHRAVLPRLPAHLLLLRPVSVLDPLALPRPGARGRRDRLAAPHPRRHVRGPGGREPDLVQAHVARPAGGAGGGGRAGEAVRHHPRHRHRARRRPAATGPPGRADLRADGHRDHRPGDARRHPQGLHRARGPARRGPAAGGRHPVHAGPHRGVRGGAAGRRHPRDPAGHGVRPRPAERDVCHAAPLVRLDGRERRTSRGAGGCRPLGLPSPTAGYQALGAVADVRFGQADGGRGPPAAARACGACWPTRTAACGGTCAGASATARGCGWRKSSSSSGIPGGRFGR